MSDLEIGGARNDGAKDAVDDLSEWLTHRRSCTAFGEPPDDPSCDCGLAEVVRRINDAWP